VQGTTVAKLLKGSKIRLGIDRMARHPGFDRPLRLVQIGRLSVSETGGREGRPVVTILEATPVPDNAGIAASPVSGGIPAAAVCLAIPSAASQPADIIDAFRRFDLPCFTSFFDEHLLESRLISLCREKIDRCVMMQGTLVRLFGRGVLLTGESGTGKTACSIRLARKGHDWVADDVVVVKREKDGTLCGRAHPKIAGFADVRGEGVVRADEVLPPGRILREASVDLVVSLVRKQVPEAGRISFRRVMGKKLPQLELTCSLDAPVLDAQIERQVLLLVHEGEEL